MKMKSLSAFVFALAIVVGSFGFVSSAQASITYNAPKQMDRFLNQTLLNATTTSATSTQSAVATDQSVRLDGATGATFYFSRAWSAAGNAGSSKFEVEVSPDGVTWVNFDRLYLLDVARTATSTVWITAATSTVAAAADLQFGAYHFARCQVVEITDGSHSCSVSVVY